MKRNFFSLFLFCLFVWLCACLLVCSFVHLETSVTMLLRQIGVLPFSKSVHNTTEKQVNHSLSCFYVYSNTIIWRHLTRPLSLNHRSQCVVVDGCTSCTSVYIVCTINHVFEKKYWLFKKQAFFKHLHVINHCY